MTADRARTQTGPRRLRTRAGLIAGAALITVGGALGLSRGPSLTHAAAAGAPQQCSLKVPSGTVSHVINLVFDNVHFSRDNPNVPSDLEQMPNLLDFLEENGVLLSNMHTPLIAHTADDILTTLTGVYGDKHGQPVSNSYRVFNTNGTSSSASSFAYWTDPVANNTTTDTTPTMVDPSGKIAPAPWVPYTRAGCDVGGFSTANIEVENADPDLKSIYGASSPQWQAVLADEAAHHGYADISNADYQGIAVHCAQTKQSVCAKNPTLAAPDKLEDEPGGYNGYQALYGNTNVAPAVGGQTQTGYGGVCVNDLDGQPLTNHYAGADTGAPYCGFPGFSPTASQSLAYIADMQEHGIPVTYGYIKDAHANATKALGPGDPEYVSNLQAFDASFGQFFSRLAQDGITPANTLFEVSSDEGDHFVGTQHPTPSGCDGVTQTCSYAQGTIGEASVNLPGLLKEQYQTETSSDYQIHADSAPNFYINSNPAAGTMRARQLEHEMAGLTAPDPFANDGAGGTINVSQYLADQVEETILHFKTGDPNRLPTFTDFANPDFYLFKGSTTCSAPTPSQTATSDPCVVVDPAYAWNHGDVQPDIVTNWAAFAGPGVTARGVDSTTWADETDIRPTIMALVGLKDDYGSDGRVLVEDVTHAVLPDSVNDGGQRYQVLLDLERAYKQLNADVGSFGLSTLSASTAALESTSQGDATYTDIENQLTTIGGQRAALAAQISAALNAVEFNGATLNVSQATSWTQQADALIQQAGSIG